MLKLTVDHIIERILRVHPTMLIERNDAAAWCLEAMEEGAAYDHFVEERGIVLPVNDQIVALPKNIIRLLRVSDACSECAEIRYELRNSCLHVREGLKHVYVDMLVFPVGEDGFPLIDDDFAAAAAAYIIDKKMYEPYLQGAIRPDAYRTIHDRWIIEKNSAQASFRNMDDKRLERLSRALQAPIRFRPYRS